MSLSLTRFAFRKTLAGLCLAAATLLPVAASAAESLKIGTVVWAGYAPFYVADALDLYKKHNLKVQLQFFNDPAMIPSAMAGSALDGGMLTYDQVINSAAKGLAHKVVMPIDFSNGGDAIVAEKSITSVADFKGKKVGFNPLSPSDFLLAYALKTNGLTDKDIQPVNMTPEGIPGAMASGSLPIGVTYEPNVSQILGMPGDKFHVVYSSKDAPGLITDVLVFDEKMIAKKPAAISALILGYLDGLAYIQSHPDEAAKIIGKVLGVDAEEAKAQMSGVYNIPLNEMETNFTKAEATTSFFGSGAVIAKLLKDNGQIAEIPDFAKTYDAQFVKALTE
ncbi:MULTISPECIES: ABC transporter substrate-binding protein [Pseudomonas]|uniref:NitT/TauT family transport system substrate-binding protein n=1 Tax=Pseudomonas kuykendallii TaxID=1007099 RepID=A0A2W5CYR6_9PSED|nr:MULTISPECIES: ABC transporter substrate-binding protein [Pseudomonas]MCQ4270418.1 ABC transporter substrate-binding protein [Pseudomonas kuykendallii]PZP24541.1 MAG: nitrate ABC transporter substrate-binding protein [Pseudomonas kuykendallii]SDW26554.1 NitT/TauT family transport system substrate-binding protein [Pseudomonas kuykendallii]